jgi:preprotein translocase subunit SecF
MNWMKYRLLYFVISLIVIIPGVYSLIRFGLNPSVEFTGGSILQLTITSPNATKIHELLDADYPLDDLSINQNQLTLKLEPIDQAQADQIVAVLTSEYDSTQKISFTSIGPSVGEQLLTKAMTAITIAATLTLIYVAYAFKNVTYGVSAIVAMLHDTIVLLGSYSLLGHFFGYKADLLFVTAVLTTLSFSVHDTIVVYDRIRELKNIHPSTPFISIANQSVTETMARSLNNSLTIIFMLLALVLLGGDTIHTFALALLIGAVTGTYSSTFTAVPLLTLFDTKVLTKRSK